MVKVKLDLNTDPRSNPSDGTAVLLKVVDGDTIRVAVKGSFDEDKNKFIIRDRNMKEYAIVNDNLYMRRRGSSPGYTTLIRFIGVDALETDEKNLIDRETALRATEVLKEFFKRDTRLTLTLYGLEIPERGPGKRRLVGDVYSGTVAYTDRMLTYYSELWSSSMEGRMKYVRGSIKEV